MREFGWLLMVAGVVISGLALTMDVTVTTYDPSGLLPGSVVNLHLLQQQGMAFYGGLGLFIAGVVALGLVGHLGRDEARLWADRSEKRTVRPVGLKDAISHDAPPAVRGRARRAGRRAGKARAPGAFGASARCAWTPSWRASDSPGQGTRPQPCAAPARLARGAVSQCRPQRVQRGKAYASAASHQKPPTPKAGR